MTLQGRHTVRLKLRTQGVRLFGSAAHAGGPLGPGPPPGRLAEPVARCSNLSQRLTAGCEASSVSTISCLRGVAALYGGEHPSGPLRVGPHEGSVSTEQQSGKHCKADLPTEAPGVVV